MSLSLQALLEGLNQFTRGIDFTIEELSHLAVQIECLSCLGKPVGRLGADKDRVWYCIKQVNKLQLLVLCLLHLDKELCFRLVGVTGRNLTDRQ